MINLIIRLLILLGPGQVLKAAVSNVLFSPRIWEWLVVRKVRGRKLRGIAQELEGFESIKKVSVVLPVNNGRSKGVERLVVSLKQQSHQNLEFIAVDSGSTDDTVEYLESEGFNVIQIEPEKFTHAYSRNTGGDTATGDYLLFVVDDAIFDNPDWIRTSIFLLEKFGADSLSSSQVIDDEADVYSTLLASYLSRAQSDRLAINVSRNNWLIRQIRRKLPLRAQFRSVSIDDTNHLVRSEAFAKIRFKAETVEDLEFALRLTQSGGRTIYTNLISIVHYHEFTIEKIDQYAKRVFLDLTQMSQWSPSRVTLDSRDAFLVAAEHVLFRCFDALKKDYIDIRETEIPVYQTNIELNKSFKKISQVISNMEAGVNDTDYRSKSKNEAREIFIKVCGDEPPSRLFFDQHVYRYFAAFFARDLLTISDSMLKMSRTYITEDQFKNLIVHLWCCRVMAHMGSRNAFFKISKQYPFDQWSIKNWV